MHAAARPQPDLLALILDGRTLNPMQQGALPALCRTDRNLLVCAATGSGKTLLAELVLAQAALAGRLGVYLAPMKAIAAEKRADWERLERLGCTVYKTTGDDDAFDARQAARAGIILATAEKFDGIVRRGLDPVLVARLAVVVVDEVHTVGEGLRGARLEALLTRVRVQLPAVRLMAMSGTIKNREELAAWLHADLYASEWRPIPIVADVQPYQPNPDWEQDQKMRTHLTAERTARTVAEGGQVLVFCGSRAGVERCAQDLAKALRLPPGPHGATRPSLGTALAGGVGYHHAGLSQADRQLVERAYRAGDVRVLVATSTVASGVNLPARHVIVRDLRLGREEIGASTLLQMQGRAGRVGLERSGAVTVLAPGPEVVRVHTLLRGAPVVSQLGTDLATHLNAELAAGAIHDRAELDAWYARTLYGRAGGAREATTAALEQLLTSGFVMEDDGGFHATSLGRACAAQMLRAPTAAALDALVGDWPDEPLGADDLEERLLRAVCQRNAEWGDRALRPDTSELSAALIARDPTLACWQAGRVLAFGAALCLLAGYALEDFRVEDPRSLSQELRGDLVRLLRFVARRGLDRVRPAPHLAIAAADLAATLEFGAGDRGAAPILEAIKLQLPPTDARKRLVGDRYRTLCAAGLDLARPLDLLTGSEATFIAGRPALQLQIDGAGNATIGRVLPLPERVRVFTRVAGAKGESVRRATVLPQGGALDLGERSPFIEVVAVDHHPLRWRYGRLDLALPAKQLPARREAPERGEQRAAPDTWQVLREYERCTHRDLPSARGLHAYRPGTVQAPECPRCRAPMRERQGPTGRFWGCSRYPDCKGSMPFESATGGKVGQTQALRA